MITDNEVHVWNAVLDQPSETVQQLLTTLNEDERARAARFHFQRDRDHFIVARGLLRRVLSWYLKTKPEQIDFSYNSYGKPALKTKESPLSFNLAHSYGLCLLAVASGLKLGIDVELLRNDFEHAKMAQHLFSPREVAEFRTLPRELHAKAFFSCWTRKEAYVKARGQGLLLSLDKFDVSFAPGEPARLLDVRDTTDSVRWSLSDIAVNSSYAAAIAVEGTDYRLRCGEWQL
jgi:4'-phosphopantetheinyl transferase